MLPKKSFSWDRLFCVGVLLFFALPSSSAHAAIPRGGNIAVVVDIVSRLDATPFQIESAEAMIVQELIKKGYRPVDEARMAQIRREKALWFAAVDDIASIRRLSSQYGVGTTITAYLATSQQTDPLVGIVIRTSMVFRATSSDGVHLYGGDILDERFVRERDHVKGARESMEAVVQRAINEMAR